MEEKFHDWSLEYEAIQFFMLEKVMQ